MILTATINEVKRRILFDNPQAVVAVKGDYEVNGIAFAFPAIYEDDFDLSTAVKTVYYKATDGIIYNHVVTATDTDTGYPLWVFKDEINKGAFGDVEFALVCDKVEGGNIVKRWVSMITAFRVQKSIEIDESAQEDNEQTYSERLAYLMTQMATMQATVSGLASGAPTPVSLASAMTDTSKLYVYTGSESGYTAGHWYYYNGSAWADGGQYGGTTVDTTLTVSGAAADAKVTGDKIAEIKEDLSANFKRIIGVNNLFNSATWITGSIDASGAIGSTSGFHYSSLIPVTAGTYTFMWTSPAVQSLIRVHGYDSDGTWVEQITNFSSGSGNTDETRKITVGSGISYVRFSLAVGNTSLVFIDRGTTQDLFSISGGSPKVVYVAASNSIELAKAVANYVCNGTNDELVIQTAINYANANSIGEVRLAEGDYYIDSFPRNDPSGVNIALAFGTADGTISKACSVKLTGSGYGGIRKYGTNSEVFKGAVIHVTQNCYDSLDGTTQYAIIGVFTPSGTRVYPSVKLAVENISFKIPANQKKIICVDGWNCTAFSFDNLHCMAITVHGGSASGNISPDDLIIPVKGCIGIRGLQGDCYGVNNIWKNTFVWGFYEGFSVTGEHIVGVGLGTRFCNYGYTFGVCDGRRWYGSLIHPNTLINCCDELNFNLPLFGANGVYTNSIDGKQYVNLIDYNMEWRPEYSALGGDLAKEIDGYTAYGSIVYTNRMPINKETQFWETGHGKNFKTMNGIHALGGTSELRSTYIPNYMQTYYDTTLNKLLVYDGSNWRDATGTIV